MKTKMRIWVAGVVTVVILLIVVIVSMEPEKTGITRAQAFKAMALALASREDCEAREQERETSYFSAKEKNNWFVAYMDYLYDEGYLDPELTPPTLETAQGELTYQEAARLFGKISSHLKAETKAAKQNEGKPFPEERWWELYDQALAQVDAAGAVEEIDAILYGTPSNLSDAASWTAYTTKGSFGFQGLALDAYLDSEIRFLAREGEMIAMRELVSRSVVYPNVWIAGYDGAYFQAYIGSEAREFPAKGQSEETLASLSHNLADLHMDRGQLKKITIKKDRISGKVLSVGSQAIEIEGYGEIPLSENFHVYKVYGDFEILGSDDILVGYDLQEFVAEDGKLCAALLEREFDAKTIRVLLMDSGFHSVFHDSLELTVNSDAVLSYEDENGASQTETLTAGKRLTFSPGDERMSRGRVMISPEQDEGITIHSISRSQGEPTYSGRLEIVPEAEGLVLINDNYLEDYLKKVVPSEMPASYDSEALKAQAVCARTYAYRQILGNSYSQYGAHVDDSTSFQVYNNAAADEKTSQAVTDTYGKMLFYEGNPVEAFYYSTSCGWGADGSVWGSQGAALPYLRAMELKEGGKELTEEDNDSFDSFIRKSKVTAYDSSYAMFRWETDLPAELLSAQVTGVGEVQDLKITSRGAGGIAKTLTVTGSQGTVEIKGQSAIRTALGNSELVYTKKDGSTGTGNATLPSAFISIEKRTKEDGSIVFHLYGGGFGHGVGMSQNGAQGMAKSGKTYEEILSFFYHGADLCEASER